MSQVATRHEVTVTLWRRTGKRATLIAVAESQAAIHIRMNLGHRLPLLAGALGRLMATYSEFSPVELRQLYDEIVWQDPPGFEKFMEEAEQARKRGWSIDPGNLVRSALTIAAPVFKPDVTELQLTVNASMFEKQHSRKTIAQIAKELGEIGTLLRHIPTG
jgi:DNA-binding IclR family transcriptional regulator